MKKSIIAAGAASVALAAMPIVGAFAATYETITDKVTLSVSESCTMTEGAVVETVPETSADAGDAKYGTIVPLGTITPGNASSNGTGTPMTITCNSNDGWVLNAAATAMNSLTGGYSIPFGQYDSASQTDSVWSAKVAIDASHAAQAQYDNGSDAYDTITGVGTGATVVVKNAVTGTAPDTKPIAADGVVVTPYYIAFADSEQEEGAYTGYITYTFVATNS